MEFVQLEDDFLSIDEGVVKQNVDESLYSVAVDMNVLSHQGTSLNMGLKSNLSQDADTDFSPAAKPLSKLSSEWSQSVRSVTQNGSPYLNDSEIILKDPISENGKKDAENEEAVADIENSALNKEASESCCHNHNVGAKCDIYDLQLQPVGVKMLSKTHAGGGTDENNTCKDFGTFVKWSVIPTTSSKKWEESNLCNPEVPKVPKSNLELQSIMKKDSFTKNLSKNVHFGFPVAWMKYYTEDPDENASTASTEILFSDDEGEAESSPLENTTNDQEVPLSDVTREPCNKRICLEYEHTSKFVPSFNFPAVISIPSLDIVVHKPSVGQESTDTIVFKDVQHDEHHQHQMSHHDDSSSSNLSSFKGCSSTVNESITTDVVSAHNSCEQSPLQHSTSHDDIAIMGAVDKSDIEGQSCHFEEEQPINHSIVPCQNLSRNHEESTIPDLIPPDTNIDTSLEIPSYSGKRNLLQLNSPVKENDEGTILIQNTSEDAADCSNNRPYYTDFTDMTWDETLHEDTRSLTSCHGEMQMVPEKIGCDETSDIEGDTRITSHRVCSSIFQLGEGALLDEVTLSPLCISDGPSKISLAKGLIENDEASFYDESSIHDFPKLILSDTILQNPEIPLSGALPSCKETPCEKECFCYADIDEESCSSQISATPTEEVQPLAKSLNSEAPTFAQMENQNEVCPVRKSFSLNEMEKENSSKEKLQKNQGTLQAQFQHTLEKSIDDLDGPELLHMAMQLMETALRKKPALESDCLQTASKSVEAVSTLKALPAFTWKKYTYASQSAVPSSIFEETEEAVDTTRPPAVNQYRNLYVNKSCSRPLRVGLSKRRRSHSALHQPYYTKPSSTPKDHCQEVPNREVHVKEEYQEEY